MSKLLGSGMVCGPVGWLPAAVRILLGKAALLFAFEMQKDFLFLLFARFGHYCPNRDMRSCIDYSGAATLL